MGLLAFPAMLKARYDTSLASGVICAGGTLGILIPPSIMLIVYAAASGVSIVKLYAGALLPGLALAGLYIIYVVLRATLQPEKAPKPSRDEIGDISTGAIFLQLLTSFFPLAFLILAVLGAILFGLGLAYFESLEDPGPFQHVPESVLDHHAENLAQAVQIAHSLLEQECLPLEKTCITGGSLLTRRTCRYASRRLEG